MGVVTINWLEKATEAPYIISNPAEGLPDLSAASAMNRPFKLRHSEQSEESRDQQIYCGILHFVQDDRGKSDNPLSLARWREGKPGASTFRELSPAGKNMAIT